MTFYFLKKVWAMHESVVTLALDVVNIAILTTCTSTLVIYDIVI